METLVQLRGAYRGCLTKFIEKLEVFLKTEVDDSDLYVSHLSQLTEKYTKIQHLNDEILKLNQGEDGCTERDICNEIESSESYEDKFIYWKTKLERCINRTDNGTDTHSISSTLKGSRAREVVESFPPTAENYTQAIECLKARFGREGLLVEAYVRELLSLVLNNVLNNKHKLPLIKLYDRIETQLRSLQMLGVTSDKYASMLYPLVESCLHINLLRIWERHLYSITFTSDEKFSKLETLMKFLGKEIEGEEKINLAKSVFRLEHKTKKNQPMKSSFNRNRNITTDMELSSSVQGSAISKNSQCVFCDKTHSSAECSYAQGLPVEQRESILIKKGGCFRCLKLNHVSRTCRSEIKCLNCGRLHHLLMCFNNQIQTTKEISKPKPDNDIPVQDQTLANVSPTPHVLLQTLDIHLRGEKGKVKIRAIIDSASQRSYILNSTAQRLNYQPDRRESLRHSLVERVPKSAITKFIEHFSLMFV
ncbi:hypothetical protein AVEN_199644-1 [Araneus ventricosus]|uniref:Peptidase aspartic putative domain-containing protein n=1 Tax=Araneus ventricosus TaxID=182803 RepID=A0A4Y2DH91_ARAVE|nr:hypothetical protein AVEN_199644-1 [Araneus ventricosus]